ncbi:unnamed protein product [Polarella glacialis]|uniref:Uncharacterized protein n=1 Tax=Polarella glacialis TaxID=89957 RepID=A0A813JN52_POLGL|nr:unnamed protein product [Polarella glacialis]
MPKVCLAPMGVSRRTPRAVLIAIFCQLLLLLMARQASAVEASAAGSEDDRRLQQEFQNMPPQKMIITNDSPAPDTWIVQELQMSFGQCHEERRVPAFSTAVFSSGTRRENLQLGATQTDGMLAFDGSLSTHWMADCKLGLGGCKPYSAYLGLDIQGTKDWEKAYENRKAIWNISEPLFKALEVHCIKIYQSDDPRYKVDRIAVQEVGVNPVSKNYTFRTLEIFSASSGGMWATRPATEGILWRVTNLSPTLAKWELTELMFYEDDLCTFNLKSSSISSGSAAPLDESANNAFDGRLDSHWRAKCGLDPDGCRKGEAWIGFDFGRSSTVRCIRMYQTKNNLEAIVAEHPSESRGIQLEAWNGVVWLPIQRYWDPAFAPPMADLIFGPTMVTPFMGGAPDVWEDTRPSNLTAWKISNDDYTRGFWQIHELQFFDTVSCTGTALVGAPISMAGPQDISNAKRAFDGNDRHATGWKSSCIGGTCILGKICLTARACLPREGWVGLYFGTTSEEKKAGLGSIGERQPQVKCIRVHQSRNQQNQAKSVLVEKYIDGDWQADSLHRDIGGGTWNQRPAPAYTMWRVTNNEPIKKQWRMLELAAFKDPLCIDPVSSGTPISSGFLLYSEGPNRAFDSSARTAFGADCENCNISREYWIGMQLASDAPDQKRKESFVRCVRTWQSPDMDQQVRSMKFELFGGKDWMLSPISGTGSIEGGGGGIWSRQPAGHMTKWRVMPTREEDGNWRVYEIEFYADSECLHPLRSIRTGSGGATMSLSGYRPSVTNFDLADMEPLFTEGTRVQDFDMESSILIEHRPTEQLPAVLGMDFLSEASWIRCMRLRQGPLDVEMAKSLQVQLWDGSKWKDGDPELSEREVLFEGLGGGGWQRRPAADSTIWRLENDVYVEEGWAVHEAEFYTDPLCSAESKMSGEPISSGFVPLVSRNGPQMAFDGDSMTSWVSQCAIIPIIRRPVGYEEVELPYGCKPKEAWLGLDFGGALPGKVTCVRIKQVGYRRMQSVSVSLSKWDGLKWTHAWSLDGLGGSSWDQRPANANTMWRIVNQAPIPKPCKNQLTRINRRSWGVADLAFYSDDDCKNRIDDGRPISSGSIEFFRGTPADMEHYDVNQTQDGDTLTAWGAPTTWGANCLLGFRNSDNQTGVDCVGEWTGLSFGTKAVEARCIKIVQSRLESALCCDPASKMDLHRWNGSAWVEASWLITPPTTANVAKNQITSNTHPGAAFVMMGKCPSTISSFAIYEEQPVETRTRRDSETCEIQLTGATTLMSSAYCIDHPKCAAAFGPGGSCCPVGDPSMSISRCCCSYLSGEPLFKDDGGQNQVRARFNFEFATIWLSNFLPWVGLVATVLAYFSALTFPADAEARISVWCQQKSGRFPNCKVFLKRMVATILWPWLVWRSFLAYNRTYTAMACCWMVLPNRELPHPMQMWRGLIFLVLGFCFAGVAPWTGLGYIAGEAILKLLLYLALIVKWSKSKFDPKDSRDQQLRRKISRVRVKEEDDTADAGDVSAGFVVAFSASMVYFLKFMFDMLILRAQMISMGAIESIDSEQVVDLFPGLLAMLREPGMVMYSFLSYASQVLSFMLNFSIGIPMCEGACMLMGSVGLITVLVAVTQWLNYDLFGLFVASRQLGKTTLPECQRLFFLAVIMGCMSMSFAVVQCAMVLFTRALMFANPFTSSVWMCMYDDTLAVYIGRGLLSVASLVGMVFVCLCINGHFMGQDYIVKKAGDFLGLNLDALDPDGTGIDGGSIRCTVLAAALPTMCGIWLDWWNVDAYMIPTRARVYASELWEAQPCKICGKAHVRYDLIMTATARTVSLAAQIVPYGALVGKATEYLNDPPFLYLGKRMTCMTSYMTPSEPMPRVSRKHIGTLAILLVAEFLTILIEWGQPICRRIGSVGLYAFCILGTFSLTEDNFSERGTWVIWNGFYMACFKAFADFLMEPLLSFVLGGLYLLIHRIEGTITPSKDIARTIAGQVISGGSVAAIIASSAISNGWANYATAVFLAWGGGYVCSLLTLMLNAALEKQLPGPGQPPLRSATSHVVKAVYCMLIGCSVGWVALRGRPSQDRNATDTMEFIDETGEMNFRGGISAAILCMAAQFIALKLVLVENRAAQEADSKKTDFHWRTNWRASPSLVGLRTIRALGGATGVPLAALVGLVFSDYFCNNSSSTSRAIVAIFVGTSGAPLTRCALRLHLMQATVMALQRPPAFFTRMPLLGL